MAASIYDTLRASAGGAGPANFSARPLASAGVSLRAPENTAPPAPESSAKPEGQEIPAATTPSTGPAAEGAKTPPAAEVPKAEGEAAPPPAAEGDGAAAPEAAPATGGAAPAQAAAPAAAKPARRAPSVKKIKTAKRKRFRAHSKKLQRHAKRRSAAPAAAHARKGAAKAAGGARPNYNSMHGAADKTQPHAQGMDEKMFAKVMEDPSKLEHMPDFQREQLFKQMSPAQREQLGQHLPPELKEKLGAELNALNQQQDAQKAGAGGFKVGGFNLNNMGQQAALAGGMAQRPIASGPRAEGYSIGTFGA